MSPMTSQLFRAYRPRAFNSAAVNGFFFLGLRFVRSTVVAVIRSEADVNGPPEHPHERRAPFSSLDRAGTDFWHGRNGAAACSGFGALRFVLPGPKFQPAGVLRIQGQGVPSKLPPVESLGKFRSLRHFQYARFLKTPSKRFLKPNFTLSRFPARRCDHDGQLARTCRTSAQCRPVRSKPVRWTLWAYGDGGTHSARNRLNSAERISGVLLVIIDGRALSFGFLQVR